MYKVIVIDDEEPARETLKFIIDWGKTDFEIVGTAKNGKEGIELYKTLKPELIITDMQMPIMDGLDMIGRIKKTDNSVKFVILSCHEDFSFAKEAMKYGVTDYILKDMLTPQDLLDVLIKIGSDLDESNTNYVVRNEGLKEDIRNAALHDMIFEVLANDDLRDFIKQFNLDIKENAYVVFSILIDDYIHFINGLDRHQEKKIKEEISRRIKESIDLSDGGECYNDNKGGYIVIINAQRIVSEHAFNRKCHAMAKVIHKDLEDQMGITVTVGISRTFTRLNDIKSRFEEALKVVRYRMFLGKGQTIIYNTHYTKVTKVDSKLIEDLLLRIRELLGEKEFVEVSKIIHQIYEREIDGYLQYNYIKYITTNLLGVFIEYCTLNVISLMEVFGFEHVPVEKLDGFEYVEDIVKWLIEIVEKLQANYIKASKTSYSKHVDDTIHYIEKHYSEGIGLMQLSNELNLNKAYLSRIFKKETGVTITDYINNLRINKAKELMARGHEKLYVIAEWVGYNNIQHFNTIFKRLTGENPSKYRKEN